MNGPHNATAPAAQGYRRFTAAEDGTLRRMAAKGCASSEIAAALGRQIESVVRRARTIGVAIELRKPGRQPGPHPSIPVAPSCSRCSILLSAAPPGHDGLCGWCD